MMNLDVMLKQLEASQLVRPYPEEELAYIFKHALTQDAAYQSLLQKQRRGIHARVAQAYEQIYADRCLDEYAAILAQHYAEAGNDAQALLYSIRAADVAAHVYATTEAISFYTRALKLAIQQDRSAPSLEQITTLYLKRGRMFELVSQHDQALANYDEMEKLAREWNAPSMELAALMARATIYSIPTRQSDRKLAQVLCDHALEIARALGDQPAEAKILWNILLLNSRLNTNYKMAIGYGEQALAIARQLDLREQTAYLLNDLSLPYAYTGNPEHGIEINLEARQMWRAMNNLPMLSDNLSYAAMIYIALAQYENAIAASQEAYQVSLNIDNLWGESFSQSWVGQAYRALGQITPAIAVMEESIRLAAQGFQAPLSFTRADLGCLYGDLGMVARGIELAEIAHSEGQKQAKVMKIWTTAQLGHLYLLDGQIARAESILAETDRNIAPVDQDSLFGTAIFLTEVELRLAQNDSARGIQVCDRLIEYKRAYHLRQSLPDAFHLKGVALQRQGKIADALACFSDARAEAEETNARWILWRILYALAEIEMQRGNDDQARALRTQTREIIAYIVAHTPEEFRTSFLNLRDVRAVMTLD